jgi:hypothetical protein
MKKLICVKDPNPDYKKWVFSNLEMEVDPLPIYEGGVYLTNDCVYTKRKCWGEKQEYIFLANMLEFGPVPKKYFNDYEMYISLYIKCQDKIKIRPFCLN